MRVLVTGSRDWGDYKTIQTELAAIECANPLEDITLVHGGCFSGADRIADVEAMRLGWTIEIHHADWNRYGKSAGPIRNIAMVDSGIDICLAFIRNNSRGATQCAHYAECRGVTVKKVTRNA